MHDAMTASEFLAASSVAPAVFALRPDYRAMLLVVDGVAPALTGGAGERTAARLIDAAEATACDMLATGPVEHLPHISAWRDAYRGFGAKPQRTRNSLEALTRRAAQGLPRVTVMTDIYNAISVIHQLPLGGEDLGRYQGPAALVRAHGDEPFETMAEGSPAVEHPEAGEVVWQDDAGVTCRRWNWRQCRRTALTPTTRTAFFILDALAPVTDDQLEAAATDLVTALADLGSPVEVTHRLVSAP